MAATSNVDVLQMVFWYNMSTRKGLDEKLVPHRATLDTLSRLMLGLTGVSTGYKEIVTAAKFSVKLLWSDGAYWIFSQLELRG
jgi:hypothetical protein